MGYDEWWKALESLVADFRKKELSIPEEAMSSLRSAKTMINVYKADESYSESIASIENYLLNVESTLINMAKEKFGQAYIDSWMDKLQRARKEAPKTEVGASRFIQGPPKGEHWIRVLPSENVLEKNVKELAEELGLSCKMQGDCYMLVYGSREKVKVFVKKMAEKCRRTRET
ncbi:MAG: DUF2096 family protein [Candidatus Bathyarchaeia archaeon]